MEDDQHPMRPQSSQIASSQGQPLPAGTGTGTLETLRCGHDDQIPVASIPEAVREEMRKLAVPVDFVCYATKGKRNYTRYILAT